MHRIRKPLLLLMAALCLVGSGWMQQKLNGDRAKFGLTRSEPLENAPPILAFTTVALGGFRGLISNALWMRANDLQMQGKYFEMAQLADWITKLEPGYGQVWAVQAWNMAYNISVKFKDDPPGDFSDRWRWVQRGIELLRDQGLKYSPHEPLIYIELSWFFHHKLGDNLDDGNMFYKEQWANEMAAVLGNTNRPNFAVLIDPQTEEDRKRAQILRDRYKLDPELMQSVDAEFGPLEWRLPEAHAIYWAKVGLKKAEEAPEWFSANDIDRLYRSVYQGLMRAFRRGRIITYGEGQPFQFGPNLDLFPNMNAFFERMMKEGSKDLRSTLSTAHPNTVADAVYFLYAHNRLREAQKWYDYLAEHYPDKPLLDTPEPSRASDLTLDDYCVKRIEVDLSETSQVRVTAILRGLVSSSYMNLVFDDDERAEGLMHLARVAYERYSRDTENDIRTEIPSMEELQRTILEAMLDPETGLIQTARDKLRYKLGLPPEPTPPPDAETNAAPASASSDIVD